MEGDSPIATLLMLNETLPSFVLDLRHNLEKSLTPVNSSGCQIFMGTNWDGGYTETARRASKRRGRILEPCGVPRLSRNLGKRIACAAPTFGISH
jgi:hypothetical protein